MGLTLASLSVCLAVGLLLSPQLLVTLWLDLPPVTGVLRILIYSTLLLVAMTSRFVRPHLGDSPLNAPELFAFTHPKLFYPEKLFQPIGKLLTRNHKLGVRFVSIIRSVTVVCWLFCIIGFGGVTPRVMVAAGTLLLHGVSQACIGNSHRWYVPVYTLLCLALESKANSTHSLDNLIFGAPQRTPSITVYEYGFGRKWAFILCLGTLFCGGISKFVNGGVKWCDGRSLSYYVSNEKNGLSQFVKRVLRDHSIISGIATVKSVILELAAVVPILVPVVRIPFVLAAAGFHLGIALAMNPNYLPQTLCCLCSLSPTCSCLTLPLDLTGVEWFESNPPSPELFTTSQFIMLRFATAITIWLLIAVPLLQIESWPVTCVPMYSLFRDSATVSYKHLSSIRQLMQLCDEWKATGWPHVLCWSDDWLHVIAVNDSTGSRHNLRDFICSSRMNTGAYGKLWRRHIHDNVARILSQEHQLSDSVPERARMELSQWLSELHIISQQLSKHNRWLPESDDLKHYRLEVCIQLPSKLYPMASFVPCF